MKIKPAKKPGAVDLEITRRDEGLLAAGAPAPAPSPFHLKQILVPIDFSAHSRKALQYARPFAEQFGARIVLMHVIEPMILPAELGYIPPELEDVQARARANASEKLEALRTQELPDDVASEIEVRVGNPWREITAVATARGADLIIASTHGYTGLKHVFLGSVAECIVRHAPCPVLVVREREHDFV
jgi:nucleotide-binding universal stress UspA family protein